MLAGVSSSLVYDAENAVLLASTASRVSCTRLRFRDICAMADVAVPRMAYSNSSAQSCAVWTGRDFFVLLGPGDLRSELIAVHEVAHVATEWAAPDHGEEFVERYVWLTRLALGDVVADSLDRLIRV